MTVPVLVPPPGCRLDVLDDRELAEHTARYELLRRFVVGVTARPNSVTITFTVPADDDDLVSFVAAERRCCGHLAVDLGADVNGSTVTYRGDGPTDREALFAIARLFDSSAATGSGHSAHSVSGRGSIALIGGACVAACTLPALLAAGTIGAVGGFVVAGWWWFAVAGGVAAAAFALWRRRRAALGSCGC